MLLYIFEEDIIKPSYDFVNKLSIGNEISTDFTL